jgi:MFS family permease
MQDVGAGWLMTSLTSSPSMVALVEAADSIPVMLLAMPAGALADIVDRRRLLIGIQSYLMIIAGALGMMTLFGATTVWVLLAFTFSLGIGGALMMPAWSAIVPDVVGADELPSAIALNSIAVNISRAIGPAIAGLLVAAASAQRRVLLAAVPRLRRSIAIRRVLHGRIVDRTPAPARTR